METFERIIEKSTLDILIPDISLQLVDEGNDKREWLVQLKSEQVVRKLAFFDEQLRFLLVLRVSHPEEWMPVEPARPPPTLLHFLAYAQVSFDASYISPLSHAPPPAVKLTAPPRPGTQAGSGTLRPSGHLPPSIVPPATPNPMPATTENDRRYMRSEGTPLSSGTWGEGSGEGERSFALAWDADLGVWTVVFEFRVSIAFFQMPYRDPLLCLTAHITVRDKPVPSTPARASLDSLIADVGPVPDFLINQSSDPTATEALAFQRFHSGLEEVDLFSGLAGASDAVLTLPSTRLGSDTRKTEFALRPIRNPKEQDALSPDRAPPTIRKSFRCTLPTVSGVRLRRRTVLVPHILIDQDVAVARDERAAGDAERTVIICVEIEHLGETASPFKIDAVRVDVGKEVEPVARVRLVGSYPFPLSLTPFEQHNLLYAVELLETSSNGRSTVGDAPDTPLLPVVIHVDGRPVAMRDGTEINPTAPFTSSWNTTLDVSPRRTRDSYRAESLHNMPPGMRDVLPEPPSPFPAPHTATSATFGSTLKPSQSLMATTTHNSRRLSAPATPSSTLVSPRPQPTRASTGLGLPTLREQSDDFGVRSPYSPVPPSVAVAAYARTPIATTFAPPLTPGPGSSFGVPPPANLSNVLPTGDADEPFVSSPPLVPPTPAYPAYVATSPLPDTPRLVTPIMGTAPSIGPSMDISRAGNVLPPFTPISPHVDVLSDSAVLVSVGVLDDEERIVQQNTFTLDIFIFNRSRWTRRLEVSVPARARRRFEEKAELAKPGIVPLENRVRIGPLRPSTCQNVRMSFLALRPGLHAVEALVLTDVETGWSMTLRSVLDLVVHES